MSTHLLYYGLVAAVLIFSLVHAVGFQLFVAGGDFRGLEYLHLQFMVR